MKDVREYDVAVLKDKIRSAVDYRTFDRRVGEWMFDLLDLGSFDPTYRVNVYDGVGACIISVEGVEANNADHAVEKIGELLGTGNDSIEVEVPIGVTYNGRKYAGIGLFYVSDDYFDNDIEILAEPE